MIPRDAVRILMLSPIYFRLTVPQRLELVREYCRVMNVLDVYETKRVVT